jgi:hypothetical protein
MSFLYGGDMPVWLTTELHGIIESFKIKYKKKALTRYALPEGNLSNTRARPMIPPVCVSAT